MDLVSDQYADTPFSATHALPSELEREIFELAALNNPSIAPTLALVARRIKDWIEPIIYNKIVVSSVIEKLEPPLIYRDRSEYIKAPSFEKATKHAQNVLFHHYDGELLLEVIRHCQGVKNLAVWGLNKASTARYRSLIASLPVQKLSIDVGRLMYVEDHRFTFDPTPLMNITHLDVLGLEESLDLQEWPKLALLPKLTHLALDFATPEFVTMVLDECQALQVLLIFFWHQIDADRQIGAEAKADRRVVQMPGILAATEDWINGASGGWDFWRKAEAIQRKHWISE